MQQLPHNRMRGDEATTLSEVNRDSGRKDGGKGWIREGFKWCSALASVAQWLMVDL